MVNIHNMILRGSVT